MAMRTYPSTRCLLLIIASLLTVAGCHPKLSKKEFLQVYYDSLTRRLPDVKFKMTDSFTIVGKYQGKEAQHAIDNAFNDYGSEPDSIGSILKRYVSTAADVYMTNEPLARDNIVPVIKPVSYLADMNNLKARIGAKKGFDGLCELYNDQLVIAYAQDTKTGIRYFPEEVFKKTGIAKDSLRTLAIRNLDRLLSSAIQLRGGDGLYMITAGGNYEASILLLDYVWTKENIKVDGDFVIGIPSRDVLLVTGSNDKAGISKLKEAVKKMYTTGNYTVSEDLYRRVGNKFIKYE